MLAQTNGRDELVCSLTNAQMRERRTSARAALLSRVADCRLQDRELVVEFVDAEKIRPEVETFVEFERQCCGFLSFSITSAGDRLTLRIEGPEGSQPVLGLLAEGISAS